MVQAVMTEATATTALTKIVVSQSQRQAFAKEYAATVEKSEFKQALFDQLAAYSAAKTTQRHSATWVCNTLIAIFTPEQLAALPIPDTENTEKTPMNNPDIYRYPGKNTKGNNTTIKGSFYDDLFQDLPIGIAWQARMDDVNKALDKENRVHVQDKSLLELSKWMLLSMKKTLQNQRDDKIALVKKAATMLLQFEAAKLCPKVECIFVVDTNNQMIPTDEPIVIRDKNWGVSGKLDTLSEASFLRLKFAEAAAQPNGGDYDEVLATLGGREGGEEEEGAGIPEVTSIEILEEYVAEVASAMEQTQWKKEVMNKLKKDDPNDDDFILSLFTLLGELETLLAPHGKRQDVALERVNAVTGEAQVA